MNRFNLIRWGLLAAGLLLLLCVAGALALGWAWLHRPAPVPAAGTLTLVSDLPVSGAETTQPIVRGMQLRLSQAGSRACGGRYAIRYESWDDASAAAGDWDPAVETTNAQRAAADPGIIAYLGPYNSGAARLAIPLLNQAGPLVMISLGTTATGLTKAIGAAPGEPQVYYPTGLRNFLRLTPSDDVQGAVDARYLYDHLGVRSVYLLDDAQPYGNGIADAFQAASGPLGLRVLGRASIQPNAANYQSLMGQISLSNAGRPPDAIFASMLSDSNAAQVLKDKVSVMGDNQAVKYMGPAGLRVQGFIDAAGPRVAEGVLASQPGLPFAQLPAASQQFQRDYDARYGGHLQDTTALYGYEAMNVALAAIEQVCAAGGNPADRRAIRDAVFGLHNFPGALGTWSVDANGDTDLTGASIYAVQNGQFMLVGQGN
jgi:branched-chain amino acid transport system substrate-binding protein